MARQQEYVYCPYCGDPVPGPFPRTGEFIECSYCRDTFPFNVQSVRTALVEYHEPERRWAFVPTHSEMDAQAARILDFCTQSAPGCIVQITPVGPDSFRLKVRNGEDVLIDSDVILYMHELAARSDKKLWELLEQISEQRIKRYR